MKHLLPVAPLKCSAVEALTSTVLYFDRLYMGPVASHTRAGGYIQYCEKRSVALDLPTRTHLIIDNPELHNPNKAYCDPLHQGEYLR